MRLWLDDVRPAPEGYKWVKGVSLAKILIENAEEAINGAIETIHSYEDNYDRCTDGQKTHYEKVIKPLMLNRITDNTIELLDLDHDLGDYAKFGGDGVKLLDWLEETGRNYPIRIHSANVVGRENMLRICRKNNWTILN